MSMKINNSSINRAAYRINQNKITMNTLLPTSKSENKQKDLFIRSSGNSNIKDAGLYTLASKKKSGAISDDVLLRINNDISKVTIYGDNGVDFIEFEGIRYNVSQIPEINTKSLSEVKATNNIIDFGQNNYFKYVSADGMEHAMFTNDGAINPPFSEYLRGAPHDAEGQKYCSFWNYMMSKDPVYIGLDFSRDEINKYLDDAGIEPGLFTVKMGNREATQYRTKSKNCGPVKSKEKYDNLFHDMTTTGYVFRPYEPGSIFKLDGKEYVLSENHTLDLEYGADVYNLEYPSNYKFGVKIS